MLTSPKFQPKDRVELFLGCEYVTGHIHYVAWAGFAHSDQPAYCVCLDVGGQQWVPENMLSPEDEFAAWVREVRANAAAVD